MVSIFLAVDFFFAFSLVFSLADSGGGEETTMTSEQTEDVDGTDI